MTNKCTVNNVFITYRIWRICSNRRLDHLQGKLQGY